MVLHQCRQRKRSESWCCTNVDSAKGVNHGAAPILMVPVTMLAVMCAVPFLLSPEEPEKLMVAITLLLSFAVSIDFISDKLPQTSDNISVLVFYLTSLFILSFLGVVSNALVLLLKNWDDKRDNSLSQWSKVDNGTPRDDSVPGQQDDSGHKPMSRAHRLNQIFMIINNILLVTISVGAWVLLLY
ncbi:hypothetical protein Btru_058063 [Bulinus truncatus]|nr:hypothetical protein Btru_058063 [Bulinus truncatus]